MKDESQGEHCQGDQDGWDAVGMTGAVDRMLVAALVLRNPLFAGLPAEHAAHDDTRSGDWLIWYIRVRKQLVRHKSGLLRIPDGIRYCRTFRSWCCLPC